MVAEIAIACHPCSFIYVTAALFGPTEAPRQFLRFFEHNS